MTSKELVVRDLGLTEVHPLTREQIELIKHTVAVGASDNELQLFLYQAKKRGLDPLTRQIHFIKRKQYNSDTEKYEEVGTIQTGIDGFRVVADRTGKLAGISRGVIKDEKGVLIGAWAEVHRSDWAHPAREEVSFIEYCQKKKDGSPIRLWAAMPETMIKKVAEAAALRMAFPEDLSGIYTHDEMQQADSEPLPQATPKPSPKAPQALSSPAEKEVSGNLSPVVEAEVVETPDIDTDWLTETLRIIKWTSTTAVSWLRSQFKVEGGKTLTEVLTLLDEKQIGAFVDHIKSMRESAGQ